MVTLQIKTIDQYVLYVKLKAYRLDKKSVTFMRRYCTNRLRRCKINNSFRELAKELAEVPQGSVIGPLLFDIFINNIFYFFKSVV